MKRVYNIGICSLGILGIISSNEPELLIYKDKTIGEAWYRFGCV